jgi:hypothetical protein
MRHVVGASVVSALLLVSAPAARAQYPTGFPAVGGSVVYDAPVVAPTLPPAPFASYMLPHSLSHPWAIVPGYGFPRYAAPGLGYGYRTSPNGDYSRYSYFATGPFPGLPRPYVKYDLTHREKKLLKAR